jgi:hypothetical protein
MTTDPHTAALVLLARQDALQAEAADVLADLGLFALLARAGAPVQVGSVALGLMVWRDIDVTVLCPSLDPAGIFGLAAPLASHPGIGKLEFRNDSGPWNVDPTYPDGVYWGAQYRTTAGNDWKLDIWFIEAAERARQPDLGHIAALPPRLTPETRLTILQLKDIWHRLPTYRSRVRSFDIYDAVLEHGVRTPEAFRAYLRARGKLNDGG